MKPTRLAQGVARSILPGLLAMLAGSHVVAVDSSSADARARHFIDALVAGDPELASRDFSPALKNALPDAALDGLLPQLKNQMGELGTIGATRSGCLQGQPTAWQQLSFDKGELDLRMSFDADGQIAGLWFVPPEAALPCTATSALAPHEMESTVRPQRKGDLPDGTTEESVTVGAEGWPLSGFLMLPKGSGPHPLVVLVHGSGPHDADETLHGNKPFRDLADGLASRGIATLRYTKRTKAHAQRFANELPAFTVDDEVVDDATAAIAWARAQSRIDPARVFVLGHSLGGLLAPRIATRSPSVAGIVLMAAPSRGVHDIAIEQFDYLTPDDVANQPLREDWRLRHARVDALANGESPEGPMLFDLPVSYWRSLLGLDPVATLRALRKPALVLQGERDYQVTLTDFVGWRDGLGDNAAVTLRSYPALDHLFMPGSGASRPEDYRRKGHVDGKVIADIAHWIDSLDRDLP